jgi:hypothetical protein
MGKKLYMTAVGEKIDGLKVIYGRHIYMRGFMPMRQSKKQAKIYSTRSCLDKNEEKRIKYHLLAMPKAKSKIVSF